MLLAACATACQRVGAGTAVSQRHAPLPAVTQRCLEAKTAAASQPPQTQTEAARISGRSDARAPQPPRRCSSTPPTRGLRRTRCPGAAHAVEARRGQRPQLRPSEPGPDVRAPCVLGPLLGAGPYIAVLGPGPVRWALHFCAGSYALINSRHRRPSGTPQPSPKHPAGPAPASIPNVEAFAPISPLCLTAAFSRA